MSNKFTSEYVPQLDSLRFYAVLSVFITHFIPSGDPIKDALPWGELGVQFFFALSGYLITGILLSARLQMESGDDIGALLRNFYIRRVLRLFPVYYLYLTAVLVSLAAAREHIWAFFLYIQNFLFADNPAIFSKMLAHFWTLAVEEQFYLIWPFLLLFTPLSKILKSILIVILIGPIFRILGLNFGFTEFQVNMMMPAHFDTFGIGGMLAAVNLLKPTYNRTMGHICLVIGTPLMIVYLTLHRMHEYAAYELLLGPLGAGLFFTSILWHVGGRRGRYSMTLLNFPVTVYLGRISYGMYVIHFNVPGLMREKILPRLNLTISDMPWLNFILYGLTTVALSALSWHFLEKFVNQLKIYFPYKVKSNLYRPINGG
ncbi:hypothetical protein DIC66_04560 [Rhodoferax lacus]|uniref:Acyltransferase 3 domain-containing protein n=1 Tax=Rhodoferax lacus TaxID=2184758 RepID=A0A3E1RG55_9BURK|nr:acyltransferase [Rhodoferax lacus]RFO98002.1 hypothetical protein DIC66_04560 [Rhodoferax lacus]